MDLDAWKVIVDAGTPLITSGGAVLAAGIAAGKLGKAAKESVTSYFKSFDRDYDVGDLMRKAKHDITIVVLYGVNLMDDYSCVLRRCVKNGINVRYLMLNIGLAKEMSKKFLREGESVQNNIQSCVNTVRSQLMGFHGTGSVEIREWQNTMPVSYIAIDIAGDGCADDEAIIHMMAYLYDTPTKKSPIVHLTKKRDGEKFTTTAGAINRMWEDAAPI